ncbi:MAG: c-type cytochrome [Thermodesulfobacteriota bacterium]
MKSIYLLLIQVFLFVPINAYSQNSQSSGAELFIEKRCVQCHTIGSGRFVGPDLLNVEQRYNFEDIIKWAINPQLIYSEKGKVPLNEGYPPMPPMNLIQNEAEKVADYLINFKLKDGLAEKGTIKGTILNETTGQNASDVEIVLRSYLGDIEQDEKFKKADENGAFNYSNLDWNRSYELTVLYQQAQYTSNKMVFAPNQDTIDLQLPVFDSTESDKNISINNLHTIIYPSSDKRLVNVTNIYEFLNSEKKIYVGSTVQDDNSSRKTLVFTVPEGAKNVNFLSGINPENVVRSGSQYFDTAAVNPGSQNVVLSYDISPGSLNSSLYIEPVYKVNNLIVLVKKERVNAEVKEIGDPVDVVIESDTFEKYEKSDLSRDEKVLITFKRVFVFEDFKKYIPILLFGIFILAGIIYSRLVNIGNLTTENKVSEYSRDELLKEIARLDDLFELSGIDEAEYKNKRENLKNKLIEMLSRN